jgi:hypothetical protein
MLPLQMLRRLLLHRHRATVPHTHLPHRKRSSRRIKLGARPGEKLVHHRTRRDNEHNQTLEINIQDPRPGRLPNSVQEHISGRQRHIQHVQDTAEEGDNGHETRRGGANKEKHREQPKHNHFAHFSRRNGSFIRNASEQLGRRYKHG